jgi:archaellum component FlaG (FlaF/FlaG flagellin family)
MPEFVFEVSLKAIVRVRAETEADARQALTSSVLGSPSANDIRLANEANFIAGMEGTMTEVDFSIVDNPVKLKNVLDEGS